MVAVSPAVRPVVLTQGPKFFPLAMFATEVGADPLPLVRTIWVVRQPPPATEIHVRIVPAVPPAHGGLDESAMPVDMKFRDRNRRPGLLKVKVCPRQRAGRLMVIVPWVLGAFSVARIVTVRWLRGPPQGSAMFWLWTVRGAGAAISTPETTPG